MTAALLSVSLLVGIAETCATNGFTGVGNAYAEAVRRAGDIPVVICRTASPGDLEKALAPLDLLILAGGEDVVPSRYGAAPSPRLGGVNAARDEFEWRLLAAAVRRELPVFGTCRGCQLINVFFGGSLYQDLPSEHKSAVLEKHSCRQSGLTTADIIHPVKIAPGSRLAAACGVEEAGVNSSHHQAVKGLAPGFRVTATAPDGVAEAIECSWYPAAGVQFHPEVLCTANGDPVFTRFYANLLVFTGRADPTPRADRPIGVFDSGIGGLSVLEKMLSMDRFDNETGAETPDGRPDFENESFVYFGDQANMPYGRYDREGKAGFLRELVVRDAAFLLGGRGHAPAKSLVIACNTATAYGLDRVRAMARPGDAHVTGVVEAGVAGALDATAGAEPPYAIGVLATPGTISSGVYERTLRAEMSDRGLSRVSVANRPGFGLAEAVENCSRDMRECARTNIVALVEDYRAGGGTAPIRAVILGCTHYPFVVDVFKAALAELKARKEYSALIADGLVFVDPAEYTAAGCYRALRKDGLARSPGAGRRGDVKAFISVGRNGPLPDSVKYGRECLAWTDETETAPLTAENLPEDSRSLIRSMMPACAERLGL